MKRDYGFEAVAALAFLMGAASFLIQVHYLASMVRP